MTKGALVFVFDSTNIHSLSPLIGAIETDGRFDDLEVCLCKTWMGLNEQVEALAGSHDKVVVGFSFATPGAPRIARTVQEMRGHLRLRRLSNVILVAGGPHPSGAWQQTLAMGFDAVVIGEGEISFPALLHALYAGTGPEHVEGIACRKGAEVHRTGRTPRVEYLDGYPPFAERLPLFSSIEITRGCPWGCRYCQTTYLFGKRRRHRSIDGIVRWAEVSRRHDRWEMRFVTPDAFTYGSDDGRPRLDLLAEMLRAVNRVVGREHTYLGSFPSEVRPESVSREAVELVRAYAANDSIVIGAQSGSQRMLDLARRGNTVEDVYRAVRITREAGLGACVDFIFGMPGENEDDRRQTRKVIKDLVDIGARIHSHTFMPLAGTPWEAAPAGRIDEKTLRLLERLTGTGQHYGRWRRQQDAAREVAGLREAADG
jgi:B12-binding domain/radical SAM domain protein